MNAFEEFSGSIRTELVEPFIEAIRLTFQEMIGTPIIVKEVCQGPLSGITDGLTAVLALQTQGEGFLSLHTSKQAANVLAEKMLAGVAVQRDDALVRDCVGE